MKKQIFAALLMTLALDTAFAARSAGPATTRTVSRASMDPNLSLTPKVECNFKKEARLKAEKQQMLASQAGGAGFRTGNARN